MYNMVLVVILAYGGVWVTNKPVKGVPIVGEANVAEIQSMAPYKSDTISKKKVMSVEEFLETHKVEIKKGIILPLGNVKGTDTLSYWDHNASQYFYTDNPDSWADSLHNVRFTPVHSGTLQGAAFWFYNLRGNGTIRIHVWASNGEFPTTELGHLDISSNSIYTDGRGTYIDLSSLNIPVRLGSDFHIGFSCISPGETLGIILDTSGLASNRCIDMWGGYGWEHTSSWISGVDFLINAYVNTSGGSYSCNLVPYKPSGWYSSLVISANPDDTTAAPPGNYSTATGDSQYIHWAVANLGPDSIPSTDTVYYYLYREGTPIAGWYTLGLPANTYAYVKNYKIHESADGSYTYQITADPANKIPETNETDNSHSETYTWGSGGGGGGGGSTREADFVIITSSTFAPYFQPLADWKNEKGIRTRIVTLDTIYANYTGYDNAEKIRNFIKDMNTKYGTMYFLLGGQCDYENGEEIVPRRNTFVFRSGAGYYADEDTIISDLYFADLNGTWDGDGDHTYGETNDNVDMYPDVYVGRAPVKTIAQVQNFVNKVLAYEKSPNTTATYLKSSFHPQGNLWNTNHGTSMPDTMVKFDPAGWTHKFMREDIEGISRTAVNNEFNKGYHLVHFVGHGNEYGVYYNLGYNTMMNNSDADNLGNGFSKLSIVTSIACFSGAMDEVPNGDCFAEHLVNATGGGAVASLFNSRYGWGYSSPEGALGPSGEQSKYFFRAIHQNGLYILGQAWANMQSSMVPDAGSDDYFRWCLYERNLLGDPTLEIWTDIPTQIVISVSTDTILEGRDTTITVTVSDAKAPIQGAVVTLLQKSQGDSYYIYLVDTTNASGIASFTVNASQTNDIVITATKHNYLYAQDTVKVVQVSGIEDQNHITTTDISLVSNVLRNSLVIRYAVPSSQKVSLRMYDINGRLVKSYSDRINGGTGVLKLNVDDLREGIYFVKVESKGINMINKVIKTK